MKFLERLEQLQRGLLIEKEQAPLPPGTAENAPTPQEVQSQQPAEAPPTEAPPAEAPKELSPESEVMLVRLLKKAFVVSPQPEDIEQIDDMNDINESNARECLTKIINLIKKYSTDVDLAI